MPVILSAAKDLFAPERCIGLGSGLKRVFVGPCGASSK